MIEKKESLMNDIDTSILARYRVEKKGNDAHIYERVKLPKTYAGKKGVKEFIESNGKVVYYIEKLVKKYSDNVVEA